MNQFNDIRLLLDSMESIGAAGANLQKFKDALTDIASSLSALVQAAEREPAADTSIAQAIAGLRFPAPEVTVNVPQQAQPNITVQPSQVVVMPSETAPKGWLLSITKYDGNGKAREIKFTPET